MRLAGIALISAASLASGARAQQEAWRLEGVSSLPGIGHSVAFLGDLNGDGVRDYVAGGPAVLLAPEGIGHVFVASGADGSLLFDFAGAPSAEFGFAVASAGDLDGDGIDDVAAGAPADGNGVVHIYSGATGTLIRTLTGASAASRFGSALANLGDVNGDGYADLAVGAPDDASGGSKLGLAAICSGADGSLLAQWNGATAGGGFGSVLDDAGDLDHDGVHDLLVVEQADSTSGTASGTLRIFSGATFALLRAWNLGPAAGGWTARGAGDVNGDGTDDVIVGNDHWPVTYYGPYHLILYQGGVWLLDGASGATLYAYTTYAETGGAVGKAGDVDGDGFGDFVFWLNESSSDRFRIFSGKLGTPLASGLDRAKAFSGGVDVSGDGTPDLIVGLPLDPTYGNYSGAAKAFDPVSQSYVRASFGHSRADFLGRASALLDDVNGDGVRDVLVGLGMLTMGASSARVLSGADRSELRVHSGTGVNDFYAISVAALPDLDGDAIGEYAIGFPGPTGLGQGVVEIRSGATGNLLGSLAPPGGGTGAFGTSLAVAFQTSGALQLAAGSPEENPSGSVHVFDLSNRNVVATASGSGNFADFGFSVAYVGDVDGDGTGDWAMGSPQTRSVAVFSGGSGATLKTVTGAKSSAFGNAVCGPGDVDGDGIPDLYVGAPTESAGLAGRVYLYSGASWSVLRRWDGTEYGLGESVTAVGDVNGDGISDALLGQRDKAFLTSGGTGGLLYRFDGDNVNDYFGWSPAGVAAPGSTGSMNGDAIPDVAIGNYLDHESGADAGRLSLYFLDDLYLQIDPTTANAGDVVTLATSGGPGGALSMVVAVAFDATPLFLPLSFGTFDAVGRWSLSAAVPPGLAGHTITMTSYAIGFSGKLVDTQSMVLALQ